MWGVLFVQCLIDSWNFYTKVKEKVMNFNRIKKVVVVYGEAGTGKTTALCMLCEKLIAKCLSHDRFVLQKKGHRGRLTTVPKNKKGAYQDLLCAVHCKTQSGNNEQAGKDVMVGIGTAGDIWESVEQAFMFFDSVFPEDEFAYVVIAIRKQPRKDGLGVAEKSFPLMALERMERDGLLDVIRPFEKAPNAARLLKNANAAQKAQFNANCQALAQKLEAMI